MFTKTVLYAIISLSRVNTVTREVGSLWFPVFKLKSDKNQSENTMTQNPKRNKGQHTLDSWESANGELCLKSILPWVDEKNLSHSKITAALEEFKLRMIASGNVYADFRAAFKVWLTKGYLGITLDQARAQRDMLASITHDKGGCL